jgi:hypothetical protein
MAIPFEGAAVLPGISFPMARSEMALRRFLSDSLNTSLDSGDPIDCDLLPINDVI